MHDSSMPLSGMMQMLGMMVNAFYGGCGVGFLNYFIYIIVAVFITLAIGLSITTALGLVMVNAFNPISVAFAVLFVGLGVDFGIQYSVRYRTERFETDDLKAALIKAGEYSAVANSGIPMAADRTTSGGS